MKSNYYPLIIVLCGSLMLNIALYLENTDLLAITKEESQPVFIWNDDLEGLPVDGTPIMLEYTSNDTIYLGVAEEIDPCEYQFIVTDDSISVSDFGRTVGKVKIEGQLEQLIINDNL